MYILAMLKCCCDIKDNFADLSSPLIEILKKQNNGKLSSSPINIQAGGISFVTSWSGKVFADVEPVIAVNEKFALNNGFSKDCMVDVSLYYDEILPSTSLTLSPLDGVGYDTLSINGKDVENSLRNQVLFLKKDLVFIYHLSSSVSVPVKVLDTESSDIVCLQENTEVHILPPISQQDCCDKQDNTRNGMFTKQNNIKIKHLDCSLNMRSFPMGLYFPNVSDTIIPPYQCFLSKNFFINGNHNWCPRNHFLAEVSVKKKSDQDHSKSEADGIKIVLKINILPKHQFEKLFVTCEPDDLYANPVVLEQLQISSGDVININCYHHKISSVHGIVLHCNSKINVREQEIKDVVSKYLNTCFSTCKEDMIMNQGTLLRFTVNNEAIIVLVELIGIVNEVCGLIDMETLSFINVEFDEEPLPNEPMQTKQLVEKDPLIDIIYKLKEVLTLKTLRSKRCLFTTHQHFVLLYGASSSVSSGCGKSYVAFLLKEIVTKNLSDFFVHIIDCVSLRGKKTETVVDHWNSVFEKYLNRHSGLIVFDDLDEVLPSLESFQENGQRNIYGERLTEAFYNFLKIIRFSGKSIHVIATTSSLESLNTMILPNSNRQLFTHFFKLPTSFSEPAKVLLNLLSASSDGLDYECKLTENETEDLNKSMEGLNFRDVHSICKEVINTRVGNKDNLLLTYDELIRIIKEYKNSLKRHMSLHLPENISWENIGGLENIKTFLQEELIWPETYQKLFGTSACLKSGILLYGAPGTGKTMLASAVAFESKLNFLSVKGPELLSKYIGSSESNVRDLFARAHSAEPCILFFDEIDSLTPKRGHDNTGVTDRVVNQLLTQLDGVESLGRVYVLAATSRPDLIDPALLRPGRLDKSIMCPLPSESEREKIVTVLTRDLKISDDVCFKSIAKATENYTGADLKALVYCAQLRRINLCIEAGEIENDQKQVVVEMEDFGHALSSTSPSLSLAERELYASLFSRFRNSSKERPDFTKAKVTLA